MRKIVKEYLKPHETRTQEDRVELNDFKKNLDKLDKKVSEIK
jgi:hypothetical protein